MSNEEDHRTEEDRRMLAFLDMSDSFDRARETFAVHRDGWSKAWKWAWKRLDRVPTMTREERRLLTLVLALICLGSRQAEKRRLPQESVN